MKWLPLRLEEVAAIAREVDEVVDGYKQLVVVDGNRNTKSMREIRTAIESRIGELEDFYNDNDGGESPDAWCTRGSCWGGVPLSVRRPLHTCLRLPRAGVCQRSSDAVFHNTTPNSFSPSALPSLPVRTPYVHSTASRRARHSV